ncbi:hypothetical protein M7775_07760 [Sporomusa sphaeroides DSM 2875]|uniref:hypothetical protein n=1 Tax=Sporomusa sphaeroides TaxID=47679 RepID=UPI00202DC04D|nr:hypothetical protein [Sporomusa sphaeroides]MCM0758468.1 hypothetical protein [Sporomusa sphaeroides DSM 2875]
MAQLTYVLYVGSHTPSTQGRKNIAQNVRLPKLNGNDTTIGNRNTTAIQQNGSYTLTAPGNGPQIIQTGLRILLGKVISVPCSSVTKTAARCTALSLDRLVGRKNARNAA